MSNKNHAQLLHHVAVRQLRGRENLALHQGADAFHVVFLAPFEVVGDHFCSLVKVLVARDQKPLQTIVARQIVLFALLQTWHVRVQIRAEIGHHGRSVMGRRHLRHLRPGAGVCDVVRQLCAQRARRVPR